MSRIFSRRHAATVTLQCKTNLDVHSTLLVMHFLSSFRNFISKSEFSCNMFRKAYLKHRTPYTNNLLMRHFCVTFDVTAMMAGKNQAALAVCAQTKVIFPFKTNLGSCLDILNLHGSVKCNGQKQH